MNHIHLFTSTTLTSSLSGMNVLQSKQTSNYYTLKIKFKYLSSFSVLFFLSIRVQKLFDTFVHESQNDALKTFKSHGQIS